METLQAVRKIVFLSILQIVVVSCRNSAEPPYFIKTSSMVCFGNPDMLVNISCKLKPIDWDKTVAIMDSDLVGEIRNASLHLQLFKYTNQFRPFLLNLSLNLCDMLDSSKGSSYAKVMLKVLTRYTSINHGCPYTGHLAAHNIHLDPKAIPFTIPSGKYKMLFEFFEGWPYVHIGTVEAVAIVTEENPNQRARRKKKDQKNLHFLYTVK